MGRPALRLPWSDGPTALPDWHEQESDSSSDYASTFSALGRSTPSASPPEYEVIEAPCVWTEAAPPPALFRLHSSPN